MKQTINKKRHQRGLSLIELMISMVVGLFLLAGVVTNFIGTKDTDRTRLAVSEMDATSNFIFDTMRKAITHAGYVSVDPIIQAVPGFYTERDATPLPNQTCGNGSQRDLTNMRMDRTRDLANRDTLTVISLADNPCRDGLSSCSNDADVDPEALVYYDCAGGGTNRDADDVACSTDLNVGMPERAQARIYSSFRLLINAGSPNDRTLYCDGNRGGTQPLAENVEAVQYLYGVREANNSVTFKNADQVSTDNDWEKVRSVQVALLMRSSDANLLKKDSDKIFYSLLDKKVDIDASDRRHLFRVYTTTINIENLN
ncbi:MAG: PilW family protein [Cocleimonas sp.]